MLVPAKAGFMGKQHDALFTAVLASMHTHAHHTHHINKRYASGKYINANFFHTPNI
jgi:hypothetical protein